MNLYEDRIAAFFEACFEAGIKDPVAFLISKMPKVFNWLKGCFPRGILPTDIDGEVEINGHFLRLEFKHETALRNGHIPNGQIRAFTALLATSKFTVLLIGTNDMGIPTCAHVWYPNGKKTVRDRCDMEWVRKKCQAWSEYAEKQKNA